MHRLIFRADGNSQIGLGHVYRSLSLVEICRNTFDCLFIIREPGNALTKLIKSYCNLLSISRNSEREQMAAALLPTDILILDGYHFDENYQQAMKALVHKLVVIDDIGGNAVSADVIINHGGEHIVKRYDTTTPKKLLLGFPYLLLRKEFLEAAAGEPRFVSGVRKAFICMGGADPFNVTIKVLEACMRSLFIEEIVVVTGSAFKNRTALSKKIEKGRKDKNILHEENIGADRMVELIRYCDIAICPSSSVALEVCSVRAGLLTGMVAENQSAIHGQLLDAACAVSVGDFNTASVEQIQQYLFQLSGAQEVNRLVRNQVNAIDGLSGQRFVTEFKKLACGEA